MSPIFMEDNDQVHYKIWNQVSSVFLSLNKFKNKWLSATNNGQNKGQAYPHYLKIEEYANSFMNHFKKNFHEIVLFTVGRIINR